MDCTNKQNDEATLPAYTDAPLNGVSVLGLHGGMFAMGMPPPVLEVVFTGVRYKWPWGP